MRAEKKTRRKPIKSCLECNRRKQKCNRETPCNHCIGRGVEHLCVYSPLPPSKDTTRGRSGYHDLQRSSSTVEGSQERDTSATISSHDSDSNVSPTLYSLNSPPMRESLLSSPLHSPPSQRSSRRIWPERSVTDFLVNMFLQSINRVLEMIHAESFQSQYLAWWMRQESNEAAGDTNISDDDLNFGLLVIRICLMSVQCLPHAGYPTSTTGVLKTHPSHLESWLYSMADELDKSLQSKKPTLVTVQHRYYHFVYLNNYARIRDSWSALNAAVKDAHEIGLHLEIPNVSLSEVEKEIRRRTFWSLYVGDRYMSSFFGHWPLIPEGYIYIDPPHDNLQPLSVNPYVLTSFTDRIFHIKITRFLTAFMSPPSWEHDRVDSIAIAEFTRQFQQVIIDPLPPVYWLESPGNTWDAIDPAITGKREMLSFIIWATKAFLYKAFADPSNSLQQQNSPTLKNGCDLIALSHRRSFMECSSKAILSIDNLYHRIGDEEGGAGEKLFFIPACLAEALANLGVCLLSIQADAKSLGMDGIQFHNDPDIRRYYMSWFDGFSLLCRHSQQQPIARKGVTILEGLHETLRMFYQTAELLDAQSAQGQGYQAGQYQLEHALVSMHAHGGKRIQQSRSFPLPAWLPSYLATAGRSWLFQDPAAFADLMG